jgi:hypothetical protein
MRLFVAALATAFLACRALAAPAPASQSPNTLSGVTVEPPVSEKVLRQGVDAYVHDLTRGQYGETLTRWHEPVCPLVAGLTRPQAEFILARISEIARQVRAPLARGHCRANLFIVASLDPKALLTKWRARRADLFGYARPSLVARFIDTDRPVRVWHNTKLDPAFGGEMAQDPDLFLGAPRTGGLVTDSRIVDNAQRDTWEVLVLLDGAKVTGVKVAQLADYVALAGLTEVDLDQPPPAAPTILHLFEADAGAAPPGLSDWDLAYLKAVYQVPQNDRMERQVVASRVVEALKH